jgi:N-acetylglucosaminyl-diphospho-decaprenol L-rhamnosyltransferase
VRNPGISRRVSSPTGTQRSQSPPALGHQPTGLSGPTVTVIVVTYNNAAHIEACLHSVASQLPDDGSRVVVFDNASADGTADIVEQRWRGVSLIRSSTNVGFARACNRAADGLRTRFLLLVNPDAILQPGCVDALLGAARRRPQARLYGGRSYTPRGNVDPTSCFGRPTLWGLCCFATGLSSIFGKSRWLNPEGMGAWPRDVERPVGVISGFLLLIDRGSWEILAGFNERFFMYGEDVDLNIRAARIGFTPMITPDAGVIHLGGASSSPLNKQIMLFRGKATLTRMLWTGPNRVAAECLLIGGVLLRASLSNVRTTSRASQSRQISPDIWPQLWRRRREWRGGWPPLDE